MGFNSAFKGLNKLDVRLVMIYENDQQDATV